MSEPKWISIKDSEPDKEGLYIVSWDVVSPSPYANPDDKIEEYGIYFWNGGAFWHESDRIKSRS